MAWFKLKKVEILFVLNVIKNWFFELCAQVWGEYLKEKLHEEIKIIVTALADKVQCYRESEEYEKKRDEFYDKIFKNIKLPVPLNLFKGLIKNILRKKISTKVDEIVNRLFNKVV